MEQGNEVKTLEERQRPLNYLLSFLQIDAQIFSTEHLGEAVAQRDSYDSSLHYRILRNGRVHVGDEPYSSIKLDVKMLKIKYYTFHIGVTSIKKLAHVVPRIMASS